MADQSNEMGMVERVAAAIYETWARLKDFEVATWAELLTLVNKPGYMVAKDFHATAIAEARAAIEAMRDLTEPMIVAMLASGAWGTDEQLRADWAAALDAALSHDEVNG